MSSTTVMSGAAGARPLSSCLPGTSGQAGLAAAVDALAAAVQRLGLTTADAAQLLAADPAVAEALGSGHGIAATIARVLDDRVPLALVPMRVLLERFTALTGQDVPVGALRSTGARLRDMLASVFAAVLAVVCSYLVIGGILAGDSKLMQGLPTPVVLAMFLFTLAVLGLFEALHISVTQLKTSDLAALEESHPRAVRLRREFATHLGIKRFLAGRQLVVIVTVFFVAGLSGFPEMRTFPGTHVAIPGQLHFLIKVGAPGALFTLWFAQLAPQFVATQRTLGITDARIVTLAFRLALLLESMGCARPGFWLSAWDRTDERIPSSPVVRWRQAAEELDGFGVIVASREWQVGPESSHLTVRTATEFFADGRECFLDRSLMLPPGATTLYLDGALASPSGELRPLERTVCDERLATGERVLAQVTSPGDGVFRVHDLLTTSLVAEYTGASVTDAVVVERPTRELLLRVRFADARVRSVMLRVSRADELGQLEANRTWLPVRPAAGGATSELVVSYPRVGTRYELVIGGEER